MDKEKEIELSKARKITVKLYNKKPIVDIREYYQENGDLMPSKKGISLTLEQWTTLKSYIGEIDEMIAKLV
jgi:hypothetical protein